ncbi:hypothetical protein [Amycolatopsis thermoflava]|uniref:hypothetical protein n=1 Tax=Amycolatopsis thermoflava TaxID=84480 RepID=UPI0011CDC7E9|nr:hypothetical protein [Amycolatopsis thermoflava]
MWKWIFAAIVLDFVLLLTFATVIALIDRRETREPRDPNPPASHHPHRRRCDDPRRTPTLRKTMIRAARPGPALLRDAEADLPATHRRKLAGVVGRRERSFRGSNPRHRARGTAANPV